jgi:hypothetical protein
LPSPKAGMRSQVHAVANTELSPTCWVIQLASCGPTNIIAAAAIRRTARPICPFVEGCRLVPLNRQSRQAELLLDYYHHDPSAAHLAQEVNEPDKARGAIEQILS